MNNYTTKLKNLKEVDTFSESHKHPRLNKQKTENMNKPMPSKEVKKVFKNFSKNDSMYSLMNYIKTLKNNYGSIFCTSKILKK